MSIDKPVPANNSGGNQPSWGQSTHPIARQASPYALQHQLGYPTYGGEQEFGENSRSFKDYLDIILRRYVAVIIFLLISVTIAISYCFLATPVYTSIARLEVTDRKEKSEKRISGEEQVDIRSYMSTQIEIFKSRQLAESIVTRLGLLEKRDNESVSLSLFQVPGLFWRKVSRGFKGDEKPEKNDEDKAQKLSIMADSVTSSISAKPVKSSNLIEVSLTEKSPELAHGLLRDYVNTYLSLNLEKRRSESVQAEEWLNEEAEKVQKRLRDAETKLLDFTVENGMVVAAEGALGQVMGLLNKRVEAQLRSEESTQRAQVRKESNFSVAGPTPSEADQNYVNKLKEDLAKQEAEYTQMQGVYSSTYPKMALQARKIKFLSERIAEIEKNLVAGAYESAEKVEKLAKKSVQESRQELARVKGLEASYSILKKEVETNSEFLKLILKECQEMGIKARTISNNMAIVDPPSLPRKPSWPQKKLILLIGLVAGLMGGVACAFIWENMDDTIQNPDRLTRSLNVKRLGIIPDVTKTGAYEENELAEGAVEFLAYHRPKTALADSIRNVQMSIMFSYPGYDIKCISISSALPSEGKTLLSISLASMFCLNENQRAVVVDADLRRPRIHSVFGMPSNTPGLTNLLNGNGDAMTLSEVVRAHSIPGLYFVTAGPVPSDSVSLLHSHKLKTLVDELRSTFDVIVFDCPPVLGFPDTQILTRYTDGLVVVARQGHVGKNELEEAIDQITSIDGANVLGVVVNRAHAPALYGYSHRYGYRYGHSYHQSYKYYHQS